MDTMRAELESIDKATDACGEIAIRLAKLANALAGEQKEEATALAKLASNIADDLLGVSLNFAAIACILDRPAGQPDKEHKD